VTTGRMARSAVIDAPGAQPRLVPLTVPLQRAGTTLLEVVAAPLNPLDLLIASGGFHSARNEQPYVPGSECVGVVLESDRHEPGTWVYAECHASPATPGALATHVLVDDVDVLPLPDGVDPVQAAAVGNSGTAAYLPLLEKADLRPGETVLVLGATGAVGQIAVQVARQSGAGRVVGVGRNPEALRRVRDLGADAVVELRAEESREDLAARLFAVSGPVDVVLDGLYGLPFEAALQVCAQRARLVNIGNLAGPTAEVPAGLLRGKQLTLTGFAGLQLPLAAKEAALQWLWAALAEGGLQVRTRTCSLDELHAAWQEQAASPHAKCVVLPGAHLVAGVMADHADLFEPSRGERGGYQFRNGAGELLQAIDWNRPSESGWATTNGFYQPDLEAVLEDVAVATAGVTVHRGWTFCATAQDDTGVATELTPTPTPTPTPTGTDGAGDPITVRSRWLVGADGANSPVRTHLGVEVGDSGFEADWLVVDYRPLVEESWDAFVVQYCDPEQPATAVRSGPGRRRFEFMRRDDVTPEQLGRESTAWALMAPWGVTPETAELERHAVYTFRGRWARTWRVGSAFLAGDAAHLMPPFMGQGLCAGLRDARALAWRLALVHRGLADVAVLDSYGPERSGHVREIIDEAVAAGRVICELDPDRAAARDAEMRRELTDPGATMEPPHPRLGHPSITVPDQDVAGRLAPQGQVRVGDRTGLFDDVVGGDWQLVSRSADPAAQLDAETTAWFAAIGGSLTHVGPGGPVDDVDGSYHRWFTRHDCDMFLSRPDFYVFGVGATADVPGLVARLRGALEAAGAPARHQQEVP